jgi:hypothetical protein
MAHFPWTIRPQVGSLASIPVASPTKFRDEAQIGMVWSPMLIEEIIIGHLRIDRSTSFSSISLPFWVLYPKAD